MVLLFDPPVSHKVEPPKHVKQKRGKSKTIQRSQSNDIKKSLLNCDIITSNSSSDWSEKTDIMETLNSDSCLPRQGAPVSGHHETKHRSVGWMELFNDLVFVTIIAQLTHLLINSFAVGDEEPSQFRLLSGGESSIIDDKEGNILGLNAQVSSIFALMIYGNLAVSNWLLDLMYNTRFAKGNDIIGRLVGFFHMGILLWFSGSVGHRFRLEEFANALIASAVANLLTVLKYSRGIYHNKQVLPVLLPILVSVVFENVAYIIGAKVCTSKTQLFWSSIGGFIFNTFNQVTSWLSGGFGGKEYYKFATTFDSHYVMERVGLLTIILIGETVLSVVKGVESGTVQDRKVAEVVCGFLVVYSNFWLFFDNLHAGVISYHTRGLIVVYCHRVLFIANTALAAGLALAMTHDARNLTQSQTVLLCGSFAVVCLMLNLIRVFSYWSKRAVLENKWSFALRFVHIFATSFYLVCLIIYDFNSGPGIWEGDFLLWFLSILCVYRIIVDTIFNYFDSKLLKPYWDKMSGSEDIHLTQERKRHIREKPSDSEAASMFDLEGELDEADPTRRSSAEQLESGTINSNEN